MGMEPVVSHLQLCQVARSYLQMGHHCLRLRSVEGRKMAGRHGHRWKSYTGFPSFFWGVVFIVVGKMSVKKSSKNAG